MAKTTARFYCNSNIQQRYVQFGDGFVSPRDRVVALDFRILYHFDQFGQRLGFFIFRKIPENLKIFETFKSGVRKNEVGQGTAELNEMVQYMVRSGIQ